MVYIKCMAAVIYMGIIWDSKLAVICRLVGGLIVGRVFGSGFPHSHEAQKEKAAGLYSAMPRYRARASGFHMDSFTQTPTTSM